MNFGAANSDPSDFWLFQAHKPTTLLTYNDDDDDYYGDRDGDDDDDMPSYLAVCLLNTLRLHWKQAASFLIRLRL